MFTPRWFGCCLRALLVVGCGFSLTLPARAAQQPPVSKLYVVDLVGSSTLNTGARVEALAEKSVYNASGAIIETAADASSSFVLSNGTGLFLGPGTRLEIKRFVQEPFSPNRTDLESEPSISQTLISIVRGRVGICTPRLVAGSTMVYTTAHGSVSVRSQRLVIEAGDYDTRVTLMEGDVTVRAGEADAGGEALRGGFQALIHQRPGEPPALTVNEVTDDERARLEESVVFACIARQTVYFDVDGQGQGDLLPIPVAPIRPVIDVVGDRRRSPSSIEDPTGN